MMRFPLLLAALLLALTPAARADDPAPPAADGGSLTLARCVALALERAPSLLASGEAERVAEAAADEARAHRLPTVNLGGNYTYITDVMEQHIDLGPLGSNTLRFGDHHQADVNLGLSVPLYTGGELRLAADAAAAGAAAAGQRREAAALDIRRDARQAYFAVLGGQAQLDAASLAVHRLERRLGAVRDAVHVGTASAEDSLRVLTRLQEAETRRLQAQAERDAAGIALGRLLGRPTEIVNVSGALDQSLLADSSAAAVDSLPALQALARETERQELLAKAARARFLPRVSGDLRGHYGRPGIDPLANDWMSYGTASLALNWTLWDGGARALQAQRAEAGARQLDYQRRDATEGLAALRATARSALRSAVKAVETAQQRVGLQRQLLDMVTGRRGHAQATENEVLDAADDLSEAEIALALARTRARQSEATLLWTLGR
ncbi:TolC family protein [bacterium]|nr:TolC family protein [bacterium]